MKRTVTPEAREKLITIVRSDPFISAFGEDLIDKLCEWYESQNSFADVIVDDVEKKQCPVCHQLYCVWPINLRKPLMFVLQELERIGMIQPQELYKRYRERMKSGKFNQMKHWGLVAKDLDGAFYLTQKGKDFVYGKISIPERLWTFQDEVIDMPNEKVNNVFIWEVAPEDFSKREEHVQQSVSAFQQSNLFHG